MKKRILLSAVLAGRQRAGAIGGEIVCGEDSRTFAGMLRRQRTESGLVVYLSPLLEAAGVPHAFSTRAGGVSAGPFASLNLGTVGGADVQDDVQNIRENYRRLRTAIGCEHRARCWVHQVHGADVCAVRPGEIFENGTKADALVSDDAGRVLSVKYADCVPILLATPDGRAAAAVHAGWRGVVAGVVPAAVRRLAEIADSSPARVIAAIGPCIGFDAFEVGSEVLAAFEQRFDADARLLRRSGEKGFVDLRRAVYLQLTNGGVGSDRIDTTDRCTFRDVDEFFSHRRDGGLTGRMAAVIGPRGAD
jgi:purine-nucleoside/S-methyl-5'-thioadenosine phosphorylase / adenosine deaminase